MPMIYIDDIPLNPGPIQDSMCYLSEICSQKPDGYSLTSVVSDAI